MHTKVIVFDFDGTLIDSNQLKYNAYFELFPSDDFYNKIIIEVLGELLEEPRYIIIKEILRRINKSISEDELKERVRELANKYNDIVIEGAKCCKRKLGADEVLKSLSKRYRLYLSSTTPEAPLINIVRYRKWDGFFCDIFGYPNDKVSVLQEIIRREAINTDELLVVGDGKSDMDSANNVKCGFFQINNHISLKNLYNCLENHKWKN